MGSSHRDCVCVSLEKNELRSRRTQATMFDSNSNSNRLVSPDITFGLYERQVIVNSLRTLRTLQEKEPLRD